MVSFLVKERRVITCAQDTVPQIELKIADILGPQRYSVWFKNATSFAVMDEYLRVSTPNHFVGEWIERHFSDVITEAAKAVKRIGF